MIVYKKKKKKKNNTQYYISRLLRHKACSEKEAKQQLKISNAIGQSQIVYHSLL
jgi:hypothetical protein